MKLQKYSLSWISFLLLSGYGWTLDVDEYLNTNPYGDSVWLLEADIDNIEEKTDIWGALADQVNSEDGILKSVLDGLNINYDTGNSFVDFIANFINFLLAFVGLIALGILVFAFYKMFFKSDGEEWLKDAFKLIRNTIIALLIIGFAWFITNWAFNLFFVVKDGAG